MTTGAAQALQANEILLPVLIDEIATNDPTALWIEYPTDPTSYDSGYKQITYAQFANAINGTAYWIEGALGHGESGETLTYIGPNDPSYGVLVVAAVKVGYKMLLLSPRNTLAGSMALMEHLKCNTMLVTDPQPPLVQAILTTGSKCTQKVPSLDEVLTTEHQHYPYQKSFSSAQREPFVVLHTSGSTGLPKPLILDHQWVTTYANVTKHQPPPGYESANMIQGVKRQFSTFPFFHAAGLMRHLIYATFNKITFILPLTGVLPTAAGVATALRHTSADLLLVPPTILEELYHNKSMLDDVCSRTRYLVYAGGALPERIGDELSSRTKLLSIYGASELGETPLMVPAQEWRRSAWKYLHFHNCFGAEFRLHAENLYELVYKRGPTVVQYQPPFSLFPEQREFSTHDLFSPHPTKPDLWAYEGRSDDLIVFLTGLKTNPLAFEHIVGTHPEVRSALLAGNKRLHPALLAEPVNNSTSSIMERAQLIERIWSLVQEANKESPAHAKVLKTHIMITVPEKPFKRAAKGTVQRAATLDMYSQELDVLYRDADQLVSPSLHSQLRYLAEDDLMRCVVEEILNITGWKELLIDDSLFVRGMDSLQVLVLTRALRHRFCRDIAPSTIYANFSVKLLTRAIQKLLSHEQITNDHRVTATEQAIASTYEIHKDHIDRHYRESSNTADSSKDDYNDVLVHSSVSDDSEVVLLIGSTGALGANMLSVLLAIHSVSHIYCLNRVADSGTLQLARSKALGLDTKFPHTRITFLTTDLTSPNTCFVPPTHYAAIASTVTLIIHAAWPVDFNLTLASFSSSLTSVSSLASLTASSRHRPSVIFISSIASVLNYSGSPIPEAIVTSPSAPDRTGYGESKYIAEQLLTYGARRYGMRVTVLRLGQISGPAHNANGKWTSREWLPMLVLSSRYLHKLPASLGRGDDFQDSAVTGIDWMPIDELVEALVESAMWVRRYDKDDLRSGSGEVRVLNMCNPHQTSWAALIPCVKAALEAGGETVSVVEYSEWLEVLKQSASVTLESGSNGGMEHMAKANPATRLVDFFERLRNKGTETPLEIGKALAVSPTLGRMSRVDGIMMRRWVEGWIRDAI